MFRSRAGVKMKPLITCVCVCVCVVSLSVVACGADPAFREVYRNPNKGSKQEQENTNRGTENEQNAAAVPPGTSVSGESDLPSVLPLPKESPAHGHSLPPSSPDTTPMDENHPAKPSVPEGKTLVKLQLQQFQTNAWFKNCISVSMNGETHSLGCNKDAQSSQLSDRWVYLLADSPPACNRVGIKIETFFNQGEQCSLAAAQGLSCDGPYGSEPDRVRSLTNVADKDFFKVYDNSNIEFPNPLVKSNFNWLQLKNEMLGYAGSGKNSWKRVFFEDLSRNELNTALKNPAQADLHGVNFSDAVFDLKGEDVKLSLDGRDSGCAL